MRDLDIVRLELLRRTVGKRCAPGSWPRAVVLPIAQVVGPGSLTVVSGHYNQKVRQRWQQRWQAQPEKHPPAPWRNLCTLGTASLHAAGLDPTGEHLLLLSPSERAVVDCRSGKFVVRRKESRGNEWLCPTELTAEGIGPLHGQSVCVVGKWGGGLHRCTEDGWCLRRAFPDWPHAYVWMERRGEPGFFDDGDFYKLWEWDEPFAFGFSASGSTAMIACSNQVCVLTRLP